MRPGFCGRQDIVLKVLLLLCGAVLLTGCRKELCYDHDHWTANVVAYGVGAELELSCRCRL